MINQESPTVLKQLKKAPRQVGVLKPARDGSIEKPGEFYFEAKNNDVEGYIAVCQVGGARYFVRVVQGQGQRDIYMAGTAREALAEGLDRLFGRKRWFVEGGLPI